MQMKAWRSLNFEKLSSSNSTRDSYWVTSISAGTPAGYCLSQMRSMVFPLWFTSPASWGGTPVLGSIEQCGGLWQAAARYGRIVNQRAAQHRGRLLLRWPDLAGGALGGRFDRGLCRSLGFCRLRRLIGRGCRLYASFGGGVRMPGDGRCGRGIRLSCRHPRLLSPMPRRLLLGILGYGGNQGDPGLGRTGINRDRLRGRGLRRQQFRWLRHRRLQPGSIERDRTFATACTAGGVVGDGFLVFVAGGALAFSPAHLVAQVRRRGVDRHQIFHRAKRGPQPDQRIVGKAALKQLGCSHRTHLAG